MIYESAEKYAFIVSNAAKHEILLNEGERIIGFVSRGFKNKAEHSDF